MSLRTIYWVGKTKVNLMVVLLIKGLAAISSFTVSTRVLETTFVIIINKKPQEQSECSRNVANFEQSQKEEKIKNVN